MTGADTSKAMWKAKLALLLFSLVVVCGIAEIGLRLIGYRPPEVLTAGIRRTYRVEPNGEFVYRGYLDGMFSDFATPVKLNGRAFHDVEHKPERANPNAFRLMVIGDSYVAALSCPLETTFFRRLEAKLKKEDPLGRDDYEVIACGRGNQAQEKGKCTMSRSSPRSTRPTRSCCCSSAAMASWKTGRGRSGTPGVLPRCTRKSSHRPNSRSSTRSLPSAIPGSTGLSARR